VASRRLAPAGGPQGNSQTMRAVLGLRELLLSGEFPPGTRMSELPLVDRLGVSRTPVRLALATLEHEGLLETLPGGGYAVREFTQEDIFDAIELRGVLEGTAVRFAAERGATEEQLSEMRELSSMMDGVVQRSDVPSFWRYVDFNQRFHAVFLEAAASPVLERALERIVSLPFASPSAFVLAQAELPESREILMVAQDHHRGLIEAIERRESVRAEALAREHARVARRNLEIVLRNREVLERLPGGSLIKLADRLPGDGAGAGFPPGEG
jgi:GntR family transcriptional regulator of vanillate catabolism